MKAIVRIKPEADADRNWNEGAVLFIDMDISERELRKVIAEKSLKYLSKDECEFVPNVDYSIIDEVYMYEKTRFEAGETPHRIDNGKLLTDALEKIEITEDVLNSIEGMPYCTARDAVKQGREGKSEKLDELEKWLFALTYIDEIRDPFFRDIENFNDKNVADILKLIYSNPLGRYDDEYFYCEIVKDKSKLEEELDRWINILSDEYYERDCEGKHIIQ
jgi:hypothetical protein